MIERVPMRAWSTWPAWQAEAATVRAGEADAIAAVSATAEMLPGRCDVCGKDTGFVVPAPGDSLREGLACRACGCNARQRATAAVLMDSLDAPTRADVAITEHASRLFLALRGRIGHLRGSEYLSRWRQRLRVSIWLWRHGVFELARHGNVTAMTHADGRLDGIVSLDVLEHVSEHCDALREFARVLRPGGVIVLTVPFHEMQAGNERIAELDGDQVLHFGEPEYHGDPLSGGVPCFHHFGWALLDELRDNGFRAAEACRIQNPARGLPQRQWVIRARR